LRPRIHTGRVRRMRTVLATAVPHCASENARCDQEIR
jgi:hypothetical protein